MDAAKKPPDFLPLRDPILIFYQPDNAEGLVVIK
jgi:hypothetical protein